MISLHLLRWRIEENIIIFASCGLLILDSPEDSDEVDTPLVPSDSLRRRLTSHLSQSPAFQVKKPDRDIRLNLSVTETDFVVAEDITSLDSNAVVLKVSFLRAHYVEEFLADVFKRVTLIKFTLQIPSLLNLRCYWMENFIMISQVHANSFNTHDAFSCNDMSTFFSLL